MSEANNSLNWRVLKHLLATHGSFPPNSITAAFVSGIFGISHDEANAALCWAVDQEFMVAVDGDGESESVYRFKDFGIENGMIIEPDPEMMDLIESGVFPGACVLETPGFELKLSQGSNPSSVLNDGRVMIKGVGYFPQKIFRRKSTDYKQLYLVRNEHGQPVPVYWENGQWCMYQSSGNKPIQVSFVIGKVVPCLNPDENMGDAL